MLGTINIALSGLEAASKRVNASASNIANLQTVGSVEADGKAPYDPLTTKQTALNIDGNGAGVRSEIVSAGRPFVPSYSPDSPFANAEGLIGVPNINLAEEAVNLLIAETTYKANIATLKTAEELSDELLSIVDDRA
ncbi:MAG: flagellar biosynthesis protein FlgC [Alphaproteobacteria bacterium]|nr:flagellar biosynthesis protein FlgC [Alphaproteobacteria bacterium]